MFSLPWSVFSLPHPHNLLLETSSRECSAAEMCLLWGNWTIGVDIFSWTGYNSLYWSVWQCSSALLDCFQLHFELQNHQAWNIFKFTIQCFTKLLKVLFLNIFPWPFTLGLNTFYEKSCTCYSEYFLFLEDFVKFNCWYLSRFWLSLEGLKLV